MKAILRTPYFMLLVYFPFVLMGCCAQHQMSGSSVRFLRGHKVGFICGTRDRTILATTYTGDAHFAPRKIEEKIIDPGVTVVSKQVYGIRVEKNLSRFYAGIDCSTNKVTANWPGLMPQYTIQTQYQYRVNLSLSWNFRSLRHIHPYINVQSGCQFSRENDWFEDMQLPIWGGYRAAYNGRIAAGLNYFMRYGFNLNLEAGYGGAGFVKTGIGWRFRR